MKLTIKKDEAPVKAENKAERQAKRQAMQSYRKDARSYRRDLSSGQSDTYKKVKTDFKKMTSGELRLNAPASELKNWKMDQKGLEKYKNNPEPNTESIPNAPDSGNFNSKNQSAIRMKVRSELNKGGRKLLNQNIKKEKNDIRTAAILKVRTGK